MSGDAALGGLVSRGPELAALRSALERARAGRASVVLVAGDAGVGKSRVVAEVAAEARADGALVLIGHCVELGEGELPYAPVAGAVRALAAQLGPGELDAVLGTARGELARLAPVLGEGEVAPVGTGRFATARLFELLLGVLGRAGESAPVMLVFEDLHWADGSTRDLLRFLVRSAGEERLAVIATYRTDSLGRAHPLRPYVAELARDPRVERIAMRPFSRAEFADHVRAIRGDLPSATVLDRLFERSEGNPFFTEELLAAGDAGSLPASLREVMLTRLERLSPPTQRVVRVLAAAGQRVDYELIAAAAGLAENDLADALREAVAAQVLVPAAQDSAFEFRHALLRETAYAELLPGERERLHAELAEQLESRAQATVAGAALQAELAHHWHAAGEPDRALPASVRAGEEAARVHAHPEALRHFQRALELWARVAPATRDGVDLVEITSRAANAARTAGEHELTVALGSRALELVDARAEPLRAGVLHARLAQSLMEAGRGEEAIARSAQAVAMLPPEATPERARVLHAHARNLLLEARLQQARGPIEQSIAIARTLGLRDVEAQALATSVISLHGRTEEAVAAGQAALRAARAAGEPETLVRAHVNAAEALEQAGRLDEAIELALEGVQAARRVGAERVLGAHLKSDVAHRLFKLGRFDEAQAQIQDALRAAPSGTASVSLHHNAALIAARRGDAESTESAVRLAQAHAPDAGGAMWGARGAAALAEIALWRDDAARAVVIAEDALARVRDAEFLMYSAPLYALGAWAQADRALRARALRDDSEAEEARAGLVALRARFDAQLVDTAPPEWAAYRTQLSAELARLQDPPDAAAWHTTRRLWEELGFRFHAALCRWREAEALLLAGTDRARASELLGEAWRQADELDARPLAAAVRALARRSRIAIGAAAEDVPEAPPAGLSPRELEVLRLMAEGRTNREIGAELFISEKTVRVHVSRVLAKLDATNRAQAATIAHRLGVAAPLE